MSPPAWQSLIESQMQGRGKTSAAMTAQGRVSAPAPARRGKFGFALFVVAAVLPLSLSCGNSKPAAIGPGGLSACVEQPNTLDRPPTGQLPCELIPPGLTL